MGTQWPEVSVVVPVYRSTSSLVDLVDRVEATLGPRAPYEVILVDDGSPGDTWATIEQLSRTRPEVRGLRLGRNCGQHGATLAGVRAATKPVTVTIDDDLQNPPEEITRLVDTLLADGLDVVYGTPENVEQPLPRRMASSFIRTVLGRGLGARSFPDVSPFRAMRTGVRDAFDSDVGSNVNFDVLLTWGTSRFGAVTVRHDPRSEGQSTYTLGKLFRFMIDTTTGYSIVPLQAASVLGLVTAFIGFASLLWSVGRPLITGQSVPGFPFLASTIAIFSGVQLLTLGVIGEYLARMHFRIMRKPTYTVSESTGSARSPEDPQH